MNVILDVSTCRKVWGLLSSTERRTAVVLLGLMSIGMVLETLGVGMVVPAVALLVQSDIGESYPVVRPVLEFLGHPTQQTLVVTGMLVLVGAYLIKSLFLGFLIWWQMRFAFGSQAAISERLFAAYLRQPYTFHLQRNSAQLIRNVITEINVFTICGMLPTLALLTELLVLIGLCGLLLFVEPLGATIVVCVLGMAAWGFHCLTQGRIVKCGTSRQYHDGMRMQHLQQGLGGVKDVKLLGREDQFLKQYRLHNVPSAHAQRLQLTLQQLPRLSLEFLAVAGLAILVISMLMQGRSLDGVLPTLGLFAAAAFRLIPSVNRMIGSIQSLKYGSPVIELLYAELQLATETRANGSTPASPFRHSIELDKVTYTYPDAAGPALKNLSLKIQRGESIGFIGTSGAGKSTLVDVLLGLLMPESGMVRVDGVDIRPNLRGWQDQIGYVPQSIYLTDDTLRRNVAFGLPDEQIDDAAVDRAIKAAQLEGFVRDLPMGLDSLVGERGVRISGGQRQRIGIARALYNDPAVLVLDEATSALDSVTESDVMNAVAALHGSKTIIIIAHRLSTVSHCDRIYRLEQGHLVQADAPAVSAV